MRAFWVKFFFSGCKNLKLVRIRGVARSKYVGWTDMASAERQPITGVWRRTDPPPNPPLCKNSSDLYQFQERPLAKVGWTCPPQSTPVATPLVRIPWPACARISRYRVRCPATRPTEQVREQLDQSDQCDVTQSLAHATSQTSTCVGLGSLHRRDDTTL